MIIGSIRIGSIQANCDLKTGPRQTGHLSENNGVSKNHRSMHSRWKTCLQNSSSRNSTVSSAAMVAAIHSHIEAFYTAYGKDAGRPNHHAAAMHLADHYKRWGRLAPCFTHERFHKIAKPYAATWRNTTSYERGIIEDIAVSQICSNEEATFGFIGLAKPVKPTKMCMQRFRGSPFIPSDAEVLVSRVRSTGFAKVASGDVASWGL